MSKNGTAVKLEGCRFAYHPEELGAIGNIDFVLEAKNASRQAIPSRLKGNETFHDIRAHGEIYTVTLKRYFFNLLLHLFEPYPEKLL